MDTIDFYFERFIEKFIWCANQLLRFIILEEKMKGVACLKNVGITRHDARKFWNKRWGFQGAWSGAGLFRSGQDENKMWINDALAAENSQRGKSDFSFNNNKRKNITLKNIYIFFF